MKRRAGFTLLEILVAISIATILFGICITIYVKVNAYKRRSEQLLFVSEEARGILTRIARDIEGLYVSNAAPANCFNVPGDATASNKLMLVTAAENDGKADYCKVEYYVDGGHLCRDWREPQPDGSWPAAPNATVLAENVDSLTVSAEPGSLLPKRVTVTVQMTDRDGSPPYRRYTMTVRPGAEE